MSDHHKAFHEQEFKESQDKTIDGNRYLLWGKGSNTSMNSYLINSEERTLSAVSNQNGRVSRRINKRSKSETRQVAFSVPYIYRTLEASNSYNAFKPVEVVSSSDSKKDAWEGMTTDEYNIDQLRNNLNAVNNQSRSVCAKWKIVDMSLGGYGLEWPSSLKTLAKVGELVALEERNGSKSSWCLGVVCWLKNHEKHTSAGVRVYGFGVNHHSLQIPHNNLNRTAEALMLEIDGKQHLFVKRFCSAIHEDKPIFSEDMYDAMRITERIETTDYFEHYIVETWKIIEIAQAI